MSKEVMKARIMNVMRTLPPLPQVTRQLLTVVRDENASASDVAKILSSDPALAGKVLKLVNSSFYGVQSEVTKISRAVVILGFSGVRNLAMGFGSMEALSHMDNGLDMTPFWSHAMTTAVAAQSLAPHVTPRTDPEEAFIAGLLHDIGVYVLAAAVPELYTDLLNDPEGITPEKETEAIGFSHAQVGQGLLKFWELPEAFTDAVRNHHDLATAATGEQPLTSLVTLADILSCAHGGGFEIVSTTEQVERLIQASGLTFTQVQQVFMDLERRASDTSVFMSIAGSATASVSLATPPEGTCSIVISGDDSRRQWAECLLTGFGFGVCPADAYFSAEPGTESVQLVLLDPEGLTTQQLEQVSTFLATRPVRTVALSRPGSPVPAVVADYPRLPFIFSRLQLQRTLAAVPV